jgi:hypothetical protein
MKNPLEIVNLITDKVLAYKPKRKKKKRQRRKKRIVLAPKGGIKW